MIESKEEAKKKFEGMIGTLISDYILSRVDWSPFFILAKRNNLTKEATQNDQMAIMAALDEYASGL